MKKILILLLFVPSFIFSQELNANVTVNFEQLPNAAKEKLTDFRYAVESYLNNTRFTSLDWEGDPIACSFNIFFTGSSGETRYAAQVVVTSQRPVYESQKSSLMMNILDKEWNFEYEKNQTLRFNLVNFDPLTSFLDYYAYLIIAFDMDSYNPLGGDEYFSKAYDLTLLGANSSYSKGWTFENASYNKRKLLDEIQDAQYQQFRKDFFEYHYNGIDIFAENRAAAQKNIARLVNNLYEVVDKITRNSIYLKVFFDAKASEIAEYLKGYDDIIFKKLMKINPENLTKYEAAMES